MAHMHGTPRRIIAAAVTLLLLFAVHYAQEAHAVTANDFTAEQRTHTARFLKGFLSGATKLQSRWTGTDFCGWEGVSCPDATTVIVDFTAMSLWSAMTLAELDADVDGSQVMVRDLSLYAVRPSLAGTLPETWSRLTQLRFLDLRYNKLEGTLPALWGSMTALSYVALCSNELSGTLPGSWGSMRSLGMLLLCSNSLSGSLPTSWGRMTALILLNLDENRLSGTLPPGWRDMRSLRTLMISLNSLSGSLPSNWAYLTKLVTVELKSNKLSGTLPPTWGGMMMVRDVNLRNNSLSGPLPESWGWMEPGSKIDVRSNFFCGCMPYTWNSQRYNLDKTVTDATCGEANPCPTTTVTAPPRHAGLNRYGPGFELNLFG